MVPAPTSSTSHQPRRAINSTWSAGPVRAPTRPYTVTRPSTEAYTLARTPTSVPSHSSSSDAPSTSPARRRLRSPVMHLPLSDSPSHSSPATHQVIVAHAGVATSNGKALTCRRAHGRAERPQLAAIGPTRQGRRLLVTRKPCSRCRVCLLYTSPSPRDG